MVREITVRERMGREISPLGAVLEEPVAKSIKIGGKADKVGYDTSKKVGSRKGSWRPAQGPSPAFRWGSLSH